MAVLRFAAIWLVATIGACLQYAVVAHEYLGCYNDKFPLKDRDLPASLFLEDGMTPDICEERCAMSNNKIMGLQYGSECWCGPEPYAGRYGKVADSECNTPCAGKRSIMCGGDLKNSVYKVTKQFPPEAKSKDGRNLLALVMIVKDEAHTLPTTLLPLRPFIDYYYILDTGSTDGTPEAIRKVLGPNGQIFNEPFIDYGTSRNRILELAQKSVTPPPPVFVLMLSADETVHNAAQLRIFCEHHRNSEGPQHEAYPVVMDVGWRFDSLRLSRVSKGWRYVGRVHEYLAAPDQKWHPTLRVPAAFIKFQVTDPERRSNREYIILNILLDEKSKHPLDTRTSFYLARTYNVIGNHSAALVEFERRISLGGWAEEVYESYFAIAWQKKSLNMPWPDCLAAFLQAHQHSPNRAEPLYAVANQYYITREYPLCYIFAQRAAQIPYPASAVLWVQNDVYRYRAKALVGSCGFEVGEYEAAAVAVLGVLDDQPKDEAAKQMLVRLKSKLSDEVWMKITGATPAAKAAAERAAGTPLTTPPVVRGKPVLPGAGGGKAPVGDSKYVPPSFWSWFRSTPVGTPTPPTGATPLFAVFVMAFIAIGCVLTVCGIRRGYVRSPVGWCRRACRSSGGGSVVSGVLDDPSGKVV